MHKTNGHVKQVNKKRNIKLIIAYDGVGYKGWQRLGGEGELSSIQGIVENCLTNLLDTKIELIGASRTDAYVSAYGQTANFYCFHQYEVNRLQNDLNAMLPHDIQIIQCEEVPLEFHSRYDAVGKLYEYVIDKREKPCVFTRNHTLAIERKLDLHKMRKASAYLVGTHDFRGYSSTMKDDRSTMKTIKSIEITEKDEFITIQISGDGFLYNMIRIIVGTLVEVGLGERAESSVNDVLEKLDRNLAGPTVIGNGLVLKTVFY